MIFATPMRIAKTGDDSPARHVWAFVWRMSGWRQLTVCGLALVVAALNLVPVELQRRIVDDAITPGDHALLIQLALVYAAAVLAHKALKFLLGLGQGWLSESATLYVRRHLLTLKRAREEAGAEKSGEAVAIVTAEADKLCGFVGAGPSGAAQNLAILFGVLGYMLWVAPGIAALGIALLIPQILLVPLIQRRLDALIEDRLTRLRAFSDAVASGEARGDAATEARLSGIFRNRMAFHFWKHLMKGLLNLLNQLAPLGVLVWAGWLVIAGETTVGVVVAFISGFERISGPVRDLIALYRTARQAEVQHRMIAEWM